jgi:hypothetical protein
MGSPDFRSFSPPFQEGNVEHNLALVEALRRVADDKGVTVAQIAIAWVAHQGPDIVPLVGARNRTRLAESLGATAVRLTGADLALHRSRHARFRCCRHPLCSAAHGSSRQRAVMSVPESRPMSKLMVTPLIGPAAGTVDVLPRRKRSADLVAVARSGGDGNGCRAGTHRLIQYCGTWVERLDYSTAERLGVLTHSTLSELAGINSQWCNALRSLATVRFALNWPVCCSLAVATRSRSS